MTILPLGRLGGCQLTISMLGLPSIDVTVRSSGGVAGATRADNNKCTTADQLVGTFKFDVYHLKIS